MCQWRLTSVTVQFVIQELSHTAVRHRQPLNHALKSMPTEPLRLWARIFLNSM